MNATARKSSSKKPKEVATRWKDALPSREDLQALKKTALVRAAGRAFKVKGFHNTSLDEVAQALNVTKAALYYYVKGKRELLFETQTLALDLGDVALEYGDGGKTGLEKLARTMGKYVTLVTEDFISQAFTANLEDMLPEHQVIIRKRHRAFDQRLRKFVEDGISDGSIASCDPKIAVAWMMGSVNWIPHWFRQEGEYGPEEIGQMFVKFISHGVAPVNGGRNERRQKTAVSES